MTRNLPKSLAPVVECLELNQPEIVTLKQLTEIAAEVGIRTSSSLVAHRLRECGWLLGTGLSGVWEFAPGAHAGPHSRGGPLLQVKAAFALMPDLPAAVALASAVWAHGLADRIPAKIELAVKPGVSVPAGLERRTQILRFNARLDPVKRKGVPVQRFESLLVHMAARPSVIKSWGGIAEWLGDVVSEAIEADILLELADRPRAVGVRLAYLLQGLWPELSEHIGENASTKVWFGPRGKLRRHSQQLQIADTILPFAPAKLPRVR